MNIILIIIPLAILAWWISGFFGGRAIEPKRNRWQAWGPFKQIWGFIDGDKKSLLPKSMPWPFNKVFITLTYTQFVEDGQIMKPNGKSEDGKTIFYGKASEEIFGIKKPVRTVTEDVTRIRKTEIHPYIVEVTLAKTGGTFYLVFTLKIKIKNPMKILKLDEFLVFVGNQLNDRVYPWAGAYETKLFSENADLDPEDQVATVIDTLINLDIDNDNAIILKVPENAEDPTSPLIEMTLKKYMNNVVREYGSVISDFSLDVGYDEKIKAILDLRNKQNQEIENCKTETKISKTREVTRKRELDDATQERDLDKQYLDDVQIPGIKAEAKAREKANGAWNVGTLVLGDTQTNLLLPPGRKPKPKKEVPNVTT